jgi:hypothetical protein
LAVKNSRASRFLSRRQHEQRQGFFTSPFAELILMWPLDCSVDQICGGFVLLPLWDLGLFPACDRGAISGSVITTCSRLLDHDLLPASLITTCSRLWECGVVLAGVKAKPCRVVYGQP